MAKRTDQHLTVVQSSSLLLLLLLQTLFSDAVVLCKYIIVIMEVIIVYRLMLCQCSNLNRPSRSKLWQKRCPLKAIMLYVGIIADLRCCCLDKTLSYTARPPVYGAMVHRALCLFTF